MIRNMDQQRMEWLQKIGIRVVGDIKLTGAQEVYKQLLAVGHPEDENFYLALFGAIEDVDTQDIRENIQKQNDAISR